VAQEAEVKVHGFRELSRGSERLFGRVMGRSYGEFVRVAHTRAAMASARMPHRTGRMASAVRGRPGRRPSRNHLSGSADSLAAVGASASSVPYLGWMEFGGTRGRPYIKGGRYIYPVGLGADQELQVAALKTTTNEIRGYRWPTPKM
jgi:hypothetical protein